jgi:hypothetical protein
MGAHLKSGRQWQSPRPTEKVHPNCWWLASALYGIYPVVIRISSSDQFDIWLTRGAEPAGWDAYPNRTRTLDATM